MLALARIAARARSSAGEHYVDIVGVTGSIPVAPTIPSIVIAGLPSDIGFDLSLMRHRVGAGRAARTRGRRFAGGNFGPVERSSGPEIEQRADPTIAAPLRRSPLLAGAGLGDAAALSVHPEKLVAAHGRAALLAAPADDDLGV